MKPIRFKQANSELLKPKSMSDKECSPLWVCRTDSGECVSLWRPTFLERIQILFFGRIWLGVVSGQSQPPVWISAEKSVFVSNAPEFCHETDAICSRKCGLTCKNLNDYKNKINN